MKKEKYKVFIIPSGQRDLEQIREKHLLTRLKEAMLGLRNNPTPYGSIKLLDKADGYRIRIGDYRCCYRIDNKNKSVYIYRIKHRKDVYR